jgi:cyclic beta-1,2-glucan synthetase
LNPGYIKGYLPGVRENGGQYTHAALWVVQALAQMGEGDRAIELYDLLNPIHHSADRQAAEKYRVEPYVVAADVYSLPPHTGRGGWTWYTGSAAWMYRVGLESLLGFQLHGNSLKIEPCLPRDWPGFEITFRRGNTTHRIVVKNTGHVQTGVRSVSLDGVACSAGEILLASDGKVHQVLLTMG